MTNEELFIKERNKKVGGINRKIAREMKESENLLRLEFDKSQVVFKVEYSGNYEGCYSDQTEVKTLLDAVRWLSNEDGAMDYKNVNMTIGMYCHGILIKRYNAEKLSRIGRKQVVINRKLKELGFELDGLSKKEKQVEELTNQYCNLPDITEESLEKLNEE